MRKLSLHASALNNAEYDLYTSSLHDLAAVDHEDDKKCSHDDAYYEGLKVGIREARAWIRGRYSNVPVADVDTILRFFYPHLEQSEFLTGGQFFAALRLVLHAEMRGAVDRELAFVQAHPTVQTFQPPSPPRKRLSHLNHSVPPPIPARPLSPLKRESTSDTNPFHRKLSQSPPPLPSSTKPALNSAGTTVPAFPTNHNPFFARQTGAVEVKGEGKLPPLPPRKPILPAPPPKHAAQLLSLPVASTSTGRQPPPVAAKPTHITSPLMRQSLQASKVAQSMKKAEEHLERERILQVLKSSSGSVPERARSSSPTRRPAVLTRSSTSSEERDKKAPALPRRRRLSPSPSSAFSSHSFEEVASAKVLQNDSSLRFATTNPYRRSLNEGQASVSTSPTQPTSDLPSADATAHPAPPTHPDRRSGSQTRESLDLNYFGTSQLPARSKSMQSPSTPPVPPPRRRRPESVQLPPVPLSDHSSVSSHSPHSASMVSRHLSFSSRETSSPMSNLQRTLTSLHNKAQPKLDAARYKAEAGLSRRGFVTHLHYGTNRRTDEGEESLMTDEMQYPGSVDQGQLLDAPTVDEDSSDDEIKVLQRDLNSADNLKWPSGEGWKPLR